MANELILIVEDNAAGQGYQTIEAETGEEGVRLAHERQPAPSDAGAQTPSLRTIGFLGPPPSAGGL